MTLASVMSPPGRQRSSWRAACSSAVSARSAPSRSSMDEAAALREVLAPDYTRLRGGMANLADNARGQGFPAPGPFLRGACPDRA